MKRWVLVVGLLVSVPLTVWAANTLVKQGAHTIAHVIDQTGDTAKVVKVNKLHAHDSFAYKDTIYATSTPIAVTWTSHPTTRRIYIDSLAAGAKIQAGIDTSLIDSVIIDLGTNRTGFEWDVKARTPAWTIALFIDSLVAKINGVAETKDTVVAQDSSTYIKLKSLIAQENLESDARWTIVVYPSNQMHEGDSTFTTVKMICDSMSAKINATATVSDTVTATNSGDTVYTVTSDRKGYNIVVSPGDTIQKGDTTVLTANKTSWTHHTDTISLFSMYQNGWHAMWGRIIIPASANTEKGYGTLDSCYVKLNAVTGFGQRFAVLNDSSNHIPDTFFLAKIDNDTLWKEYLELVIKVADSATDTAVTANHNIGWYLIPVE